MEKMEKSKTIKKMKRFEIGDKVVALNNPFTSNSQPRVKGKVYKVVDIMYCSGCGIQVINIGEACTASSGFVSCLCNTRTHNKGLAWTSSEYFAKVDDVADAIEAAVAEEDYETAAMLRDINK